MTIDFDKLRDSIESMRNEGIDFFAAINHVTNRDGLVNFSDPDLYWRVLDEDGQKRSMALQRESLRLIEQIANCLRLSALTTEADRRDLSSWTKSIRAALRLREYEAWDPEVLHDEGLVLGVRPAGQSDSAPASPDRASRIFESNIDDLLNLLDVVAISPTLGAESAPANPQATTEYRPNTAFVMMWIDPNEPSLEDTYEAIKECFASYRIKAVRADDIEHEDVITARILDEIRTSEFLIADLTGERPSVYYEIGYAHSLGRRVIMYRKKQTKIHFDLAAYNCPEYKNVTELRGYLMGRLESVTGRKPNSETSD